MMAFIRRHQLGLLFALFIPLVAVFYPQYYLVSDEHHYARTAHLLAQEHTTSISDILRSGIFHQSTDSKYSSKYPVGFPLLMAPFAWLSFELIFLVNILLHLLAAYCFSLILSKRKVPIAYTALYLFFPFFAYYSVSLFTDYTAAALLMILLYFFTTSRLKWRGILIGLLLGMLLFIRPVALLFVTFFYFKPAWGWIQGIIRKRWVMDRTTFFSLLVLAPFFLAFLFFSISDVLGGYTSSDVNSLWVFDNPAPMWSVFLNFIYQAEVLMLIYPFMFLLLAFGILKRKPKNAPHLYGAMLYVFFFSFVDYTTNVTKIVGLTSLVRHTRYVLPVIAFLLPDYAEQLHRLISKLRRFSKPALGAILICLVLSSALLLFLHHGATTRNRALMEDIYAATSEHDLIVGNTLAYLMHDALGERYYLGIDDYGDTVDGVFQPSLTGHNTSAEYISSFVEQHPTSVVILRGKYINNFPETNKQLHGLISRYDGKLALQNEYSCNCFGLGDTLSVEMYNLTMSGKK